MLKLNSSTPSPKTLRHLAGKQADIDGQAADQQASRAKALWDAKRSSKPGDTAFDEIKQLLLDLCVSTELCNYCEQGESTDIEHIYPKSFFPERTFLWVNYLLACKTCNTHYKLDQFAVFRSAKSINAEELKRGHRPTSTVSAFIDPRVEDPMQYLFLDITEKTFQLIPHPDLTDPRGIAKATYTLKVLQIGERAALATARRAAFNFYQDRLDRYRKAFLATTWDDLEEVAQDPDLVDVSVAFATERQRMLEGLKESILKHPHPTVWREMQRQHQKLNKTKKLFEAVSEALTWG